MQSPKEQTSRHEPAHQLFSKRGLDESAVSNPGVSSVFRLRSPSTRALLGALLLFAVCAPPAATQGLDFVQKLATGTGLDQPIQTGTTRDGSYVFVLDQAAVGSVVTGKISTFRRGSDHRLEFVDLVHTGVGDLQRILGVRGLALSSDEQFLYLGAERRGPLVGGISVRDPVVVTLEILPDGRLEPRSLSRLARTSPAPTVLTPSPDGRHLYTISGLGDSPGTFAVFERDPGTGGLRLLQELPVSSLLGLSDTFLDPADLVMAPDGNDLYTVVYPSGTEASIYTLERDPDSGRILAARPLDPEARVPELALGLGGRLSINRDGTRLYLAIRREFVPSGEEHERLLIYRRSLATGDLLAPRVFSTAPDTPPHAGPVVVSGDDQHAYECLDEKTVQVYRIDHVLQELDPIQTLDVPRIDGRIRGCDRPTLTAEGRFLRLLGFPFSGDSPLTLLRRDRVTGELMLLETVRDGEGGLTGIDDLDVAVVSPDGRHVYAVRQGSEIRVFRRDVARSGRLEPLPDETLSLAVEGDPPSSHLAAAPSPDGRHLYVSSRDGLETLARDPVRGTLRSIDLAPTGAFALAFSDDGRHLYARTPDSTITAYRRDTASGALSAVQSLTFPSTPSRHPAALALSPDGANLYALGPGRTDTEAGLVFVLRRNLANGRVELADTVSIEGGDDFDPAFVRGMRISPDGRHAYVGVERSFSLSQRIHVFERSAADGSLTLVSGRSSGRSLAFGPHGRSGYVVGGDPVEGPESIKTLLRDPVTGELDDEGDQPVVALGYFEAPAVSPDGANVYVPGADGMSVFTSRWLESDHFPGFRFQVSIETGATRALRGGRVAQCPTETLCVDGALPGRTEALLRIVGPKPNGRLWPTLVKFSTSTMEIEIDQLATGTLKSYPLAGASPGSEELPGLFDREGFVPSPGASGVRWADPPAANEEIPPPPDEVFTSAELPGFRFQVRLSNGAGEELPVRKEASCFDETLCLSGAVPGRSELFLRVVGPKPNGHLWPTLVRTTTSNVEVWIEQTSTGQVNYYRLEGAQPGSTDLSGLFDREGFLP